MQFGGFFFFGASRMKFSDKKHAKLRAKGSFMFKPPHWVINPFLHRRIEILNVWFFVVFVLFFFFQKFARRFVSAFNKEVLLYLSKTE